MNDRVPEITRLLSKLASNLRNPSAMLRSGVEDDDPTCELSISQLTQSLNQGRETRVLDTALSLMCFKAPHVFDSLTEYLVKTLVSIMSSSVSCKVLQFRAQEALLIGGSIPGRDCPELIEACVDVLGKMENHEMLCHLLSSTVVRVALLASFYHYLPTSDPILDAKPIDLRRSILKLLRYLPSDIIVKKHEIPVRLLLWYLDPLSLKQDVMNILKEILQRPFLSLDEEFHEKMDWRCIIICLALSPSMFVQTRALLHNWFLVTGLASVLELLGELILLIMDIISRPPRWGIPMEVGSNLPSSNAYIPHKHDLLRILVGPVSSESFLKLVYLINAETPYYKKRPEQTLMLPVIEIAQIDHTSNWALAMNFPDWFFFASVLLFSEQNFQESFQLKCLGGGSQTEGTYAGMSSPSLWAAAASYIAWILSPFSKSHQDLVIDCLSELMGKGCLNEFSPDKHSMDMAGCKSKTKVKKPKVRDSKEDYALREDKNGQTIVLWLKGFQNIHMRYWS